MIVFLCKKSLSCVWGFASYKDTRYKYLNTFILAFLHAAYTLKAKHICIFACLLLDSSWLHFDWCAFEFRFSVRLYLCESRENRKRQNSVSAIPRIWIAVTCLFIGKSEFLSKRAQEESRQNWFNTTKNPLPHWANTLNSLNITLTSFDPRPDSEHWLFGGFLGHWVEARWVVEWVHTQSHRPCDVSTDCQFMSSK